MKKIAILSLLTVTFILIRYDSFCQTKNVSRFSILTFERTQSIAQHSKQKYYWIVPLDSIKSNKILMYPLFLEEYLRNDLENCKKNKYVNLFSFTTESEVILDSIYLTGIIKLKKILKRRDKIGSFAKKIGFNNTETTTIYWTPLTGSFWNCNIAPDSGKQIDYYGLIYFPDKGFDFDKKSWNETQFKEELTFNYQNMHYMNRPLYQSN